MPLVINAPDVLRKSVEAASAGRNTVIYTATGQPCFMYVLPKFQVETIDASLGTGTHPAFIVGGVEKAEILIGQFGGSLVNGELLSQPGRAVKYTYTHDQFITLARANGPGWHVMTNAEWAAILLQCWKSGFQPRGNTDYGRSSDATTEYGVQETGRAITTGGSGSGGTRILAGSGPAAWRHDGTAFGIADLNGNVWEWTPGMRLNAGEINILTNNNAAADAADMGAASAAWQAIDGATGALVAPGTAGTVKYAASGTVDYTLVMASGSSFEGITNPGTAPVGATALALCKRLGLYPIAGSGLGGDAVYHTLTGERVPGRGGAWVNAGGAGVAALYLADDRTDAGTYLGARPAFVS